jgi:hypothetical protein
LTTSAAAEQPARPEHRFYDYDYHEYYSTPAPTFVEESVHEAKQIHLAVGRGDGAAGRQPGRVL